MSFSDDDSHTKQIVPTIFPFEGVALIVCGAQIPEQMLFEIGTRPPRPFTSLCVWQERSSAPRRLVFISLVKTDAPLSLILHLDESELGQLRLLPGSRSVLLTNTQVCKQWQIDLRLRISDPFSNGAGG